MNLSTTISKAVALSAVFAGAAALVAAQQSPRRQPPPEPPVYQPPPPPVYVPAPPPALQRSPRVETSRQGRTEGEAGRRANVRGDVRGDARGNARGEEMRVPERQVRRMSRQVRDAPAQPRSLPRADGLPTQYIWRWRQREIYRWITTQKGFIPVTAVPSGVSQMTDFATKKVAGEQAGWKGYGFVVPPKESVTFNLHHPNKPWFRLMICDKWGSNVPGGLSSIMPQPVPRLTYTNPGHETETIYLIVDDPGWMSHEFSPYTLEMARSWNPDLFPEDLSGVTKGIWGNTYIVRADPLTIQSYYINPVAYARWQ
jgi:hypothetical protein